ncbi:hypothetical protein E2C01_014555 [Portunus trituberculatus]|uniref:Uncharacterized protein n=1 Tax=Portunus trituberculatus TaxID=210409 RepID=A0A5B7DKD9_PORTR|nr:hypothetical protein [Portunus trituberculatus]
MTMSLHGISQSSGTITTTECQAAVGGKPGPRMAPMAYSCCAVARPSSLYHRCAKQTNICTYLSNIHVPTKEPCIFIGFNRLNLNTSDSHNSDDSGPRQPSEVWTH